MFDVHVVGAGPAGSVCARECARKGLRVLLSEEHKKIGEPVQCSGLISRNGLGSLGIDYSKAAIWGVRGARLFSPSMEEMRVGNGEIKAYVVDRGRLDALLAEAAEKEGARMRLGKRVGKAELDGKVVVGADGAGSCVAKWFGFPEISDYVVGMQADYSGAEPEEPERIEAYFSNRRFPGFFGWCIPLGKDSVRVGLGVYWRRGAKAADVAGLFGKFLRSRRIARVLDGAKRESRLAGCIPMAQRRRAASGSVLLVGDAAGQVKATTGGGVVFGTAAAKVAARCIGGGRAAEYEAMWRAEIGADLEMHARVREALNAMPDWQMSSAFSAAKLVGIERFLNLHGDMDSPKRMLGAMSGGFGPLKALGMSLIGDSNIIAAKGNIGRWHG